MHPSASRVNGFSIFFNRHHGGWGWKEKRPHKEHARLGHVVQASGYQTHAQAALGARLELRRRQCA